jgi:hypothetical protein
MPADPVSDDSLLPGLQRAIFSSYVHTVESRKRERKLSFISCYEGTVGPFGLL